MGKADRTSTNALSGSASHLLHRVLQIALDVYAEETGKGGLTQRQYAVLAAAADIDGASQTDLVNMTGIDRSTLADMVARMTDKGLLERERSSKDARAKTVRPTEEGRLALEITGPRVEIADLRILAGLPQAKRRAFLEALRILAGDAGAASGKGAKKAEREAKAKDKPKAKAAKSDRKKKKKKAKAKPLAA